MTHSHENTPILILKEGREKKEEVNDKKEDIKKRIRQHKRNRIIVSKEEIFHISGWGPLEDDENKATSMAAKILGEAIESTFEPRNTNMILTKNFDKLIENTIDDYFDCRGVTPKTPAKELKTQEDVAASRTIDHEVEESKLSIESQRLEFFLEKKFKKLRELYEERVLSEPLCEWLSEAFIPSPSARSILEDEDRRIVLELLSVIEYHGDNEFILRVQHVASILYSLEPSIEVRANALTEILWRKGLDFNSLSHFQNCKIPPGDERFTYDGAENVKVYLSADRRPAGSSQLYLKSVVGGKRTCEKSTNSFKNVSPSWREPQREFEKIVTIFYHCWKISSPRTQNLSRKVCQFCSRFIKTYLKKTMDKRYYNFSCYFPSFGPNIIKRTSANETPILGGFFFC